MCGAPTDKDAASICFQSIDLEEDKYRLGHTKLFFRTGVVAFLEELREEKIQQMMCSIQVLANVSSLVPRHVLTKTFLLS